MSPRVAVRLAALAVCCAGLSALVLPGPAAAGAPAAGAPADLPLTAAAVYAPQTGQLLYGVNPDRRLPIASATKLMTALVTLAHVHRLSTVFAQTNWYPAAADSQLGLVPGERMSVHDLLLATMLPSDDDAAEDLAANVGHGSVARFVAMMNAEARALGLRHTHYSTPIGLDTPGNYSSAADLVKLAAYDLAHFPFFARIVDRKSAVVHEGNRRVRIVNRNDLVARYTWIDGVKTGHTLQAGYVLVASARRRGMSLITVVLGTPSEQERDATSLDLLKYGFAGFVKRTPVTAREVLARPTVKGRSGLRVPVVAARGFEAILPRPGRIRLRVDAPRQLSGPLPTSTIVGTVTVVDGDRVLARIPLLLKDRLPAVSGLTLAARFVAQPLTLLIVAAAAGALFWRSMRRRRRVDRQGGEVNAA